MATSPAGNLQVPAASTDTVSLLDTVRETHRPVLLTQDGHDVAVVLDIESYHSLLDEMELLRDVRSGLADLEAGRVVAHEEVRRLLKDRYPH